MTCYPVFNVYRTCRPLKDSRFSTSWYVGLKGVVKRALSNRLVEEFRQLKGGEGGRERERVVNDDRHTNRSDCASSDHTCSSDRLRNLLRKYRRRI